VVLPAKPASIEVKNVPLTSLRLGAARYVLHVLPSDEIPGLADDALNAGVYTEALGRLYDMRFPSMWDAGPLFESALNELGIGVPNQDEAVLILLRHYIRSIIEGVLAPSEGLGRIMKDVYYPGNLHEKSAERMVDSHGIHQLVGVYWSYDDLWWRVDEVSSAGGYGEEAFVKLGEEVVEHATVWHRKYGGVKIDPAVLAWNDATVPRLARAIYEDRGFGRLPLLGDALLDAGCDDEELIRHCRSGGPHVRGCWAVDLILGKS
jgi:hypothetical protein